MSRVRHRKTNGKRRLEVGEKIPRVCCPVLMRIMMFALTVGDYRLNIALKGNNVNPHPPLSFHVKHTEHSNLIAVTSEWHWKTCGLLFLWSSTFMKWTAGQPVSGDRGTVCEKNILESGNDREVQERNSSFWRLHNQLWWTYHLCRLWHSADS